MSPWRTAGAPRSGVGKRARHAFLWHRAVPLRQLRRIKKSVVELFSEIWRISGDLRLTEFRRAHNHSSLKNRPALLTGTVADKQADFQPVLDNPTYSAPCKRIACGWMPTARRGPLVWRSRWTCPTRSRLPSQDISCHQVTLSRTGAGRGRVVPRLECDKSVYQQHRPRLRLVRPEGHMHFDRRLGAIWRSFPTSGADSSQGRGERDC